MKKASRELVRREDAIIHCTWQPWPASASTFPAKFTLQWDALCIHFCSSAQNQWEIEPGNTSWVWKPRRSTRGTHVPHLPQGIQSHDAGMSEWTPLEAWECTALLVESRASRSVKLGRTDLSPRFEASALREGNTTRRLLLSGQNGDVEPLGPCT